MMLTELSSGSLPGRIYGSFARTAGGRTVGPLTELSSGSLPGRIYGSFARVAAGRTVGPLTELSSGSLPTQLYGSFSRASGGRIVGLLTELSSGSLPGRIYGSFTRVPQPDPTVDPGGRVVDRRRLRLCPVQKQFCLLEECILPAECSLLRLARGRRAFDFVHVASGGIAVGGRGAEISGRTRQSRQDEDEEWLLFDLP